MAMRDTFNVVMCPCMYASITEMQSLVSEAAAKITTPVQSTIVFFCSGTSSMQLERRETYMAQVSNELLYYARTTTHVNRYASITVFHTL